MTGGPPRVELVRLTGPVSAALADDRGMVEIGYATAPGHRRRGCARAALGVLLDRARREPGVRVVRVSIVPDNAASRAVALPSGFREVGEQVDDEDGPETVVELGAG